MRNYKIFKRRKIIRYISVLFLLLLISCSNEKEPKYHIISYKSPYTNQGFETVLLPKGLCHFYYGYDRYFIDSCKFYYVGDTLERRRK